MQQRKLKKGVSNELTKKYLCIFNNNNVDISYISIKLNKIMIQEAENKIKKIKIIKEKIKLFISKVIANKFD